jgi:hypothetical protein
MKKVRFKFAEYNATLPPYRFQPGDVVEIDDDWADSLLRKGIATRASASAETAQEKRAAMREEQAAGQFEASAGDRANRRAALMAQLADLDAQENRSGATSGHYSDSVTREDMGTPGDDESDPRAEAASRQATARAAERQPVSSGAARSDKPKDKD